MAVETDLWGSVVFPGLHCVFLAADQDKFRCTVYAERFERAPWCHTAEAAQPLGYLARDCPYGAHPEGKVAADEALLAKAMPTLLRNLRAWGVPAYIDRLAFLRSLEARTGRKWKLDGWPGDPDRLSLKPLGFAQPLIAGRKS